MIESELLIAERVVTGFSDYSPGWIRISGDSIDDVGSGKPSDQRGAVMIPGVVVPGFVDLHAHGALGVDFGSATADEAARAVRHHARSGTTTMLASVASAPLEQLHAGLAELRTLTEDGLIAGIHLEGPYLSPGRRGAHHPSVLRRPDAAELSGLLATAGRSVRTVTLAPELPEADTLIAVLIAAGVRVALGHTNATSREAARAIDGGVTIATHLFNGMPELRHREPGPVGASLADGRVTVELICDGLHLAPEVVRLTARAAAHRWIVVSDAMQATGLPDGDYHIAGSPVRVSDGAARVIADGSLAGSTRTVGDVIGDLLSIGIPVGEVVEATSITPARLLGISRPGLQPGARADLVVLDHAEGGARPIRVMRSGQWLD